MELRTSSPSSLGSGHSPFTSVTDGISLSRSDTKDASVMLVS